jgi:hypothetical protein
MEQQVEIGDFIVIGDNKHEVVKVDDKLIWYKITNGIGQTIRTNINKIIKPANNA